MSALLLESVGINKRFGGVDALIDLSFGIHEGEIYGLIGAASGATCDGAV